MSKNLFWAIAILAILALIVGTVYFFLPKPPSAETPTDTESGISNSQSGSLPSYDTKENSGSAERTNESTNWLTVFFGSFMSREGGADVGGTATEGGTDVSSGSRTLIVPSEYGGNIVVNDFTKDPRTVQNENIPGEYILVGGKVATPKTTPYVITYVESTRMFNIALLREPIGVTRKNAEVELMGRLGISESLMCALRYVVSAPSWVNELYAGVDLRFSFCSDAVSPPSQ